MRTELDSAAIAPLLDVGAVVDSPGTAISALDAASRFNLSRDAWHDVASALAKLVNQLPPGSEYRQQALRLGARVPLLSWRSHLRSMAGDPEEPDRGVLNVALAAVHDESAIPWALGQAPRSFAASMEMLATLPIERHLTLQDLPAPPDGADEFELWQAMAQARLGDARALDAILAGQAGELPQFWGNPWSPYNEIARVRPLPPALHQHLLERLDALAAQPEPTETDGVRRMREIIVWGATGVREATGGEPYPREDITHRLGRTRDPALHAADAARALDIRRQLPQAWFSGSAEYGDLDTLKALPAGSSPALVLDTLHEANRRAAALPEGAPAAIIIGNRVVDLIRSLPIDGPEPVADYVKAYLDCDRSPLDSGQFAWILSRDEPGHLIAELTQLAMQASAAGHRETVFSLLAAAADCQMGRDPGPARGAGPGAGDAGVIELIDDLPRQMALPPRHVGGGRSAPEPTDQVRRLIAEATARGKKRETSLLPNAKHSLNVWIAIPQEGDLAADQVFPDQGLPPGELVLLTVHVACEALGLQASQEIKLSMVDRTVPSTVAVFEFRTAGASSLVDIKILVTHRGRPLQEVHFVASVRARPVSADRIRLMTVPLSAHPEPREETTEAQASLEVNGPSLERTGTNRRVDLSQLRPLLDGISEAASRVLAADDAPEALDQETSRQLLIKLARVGTKLKRFLQPLSIDDAATLSMLVDATTEILPLEIAYDADAPREDAVVCQHRAGGSMVGKARMCDNAGADVVCPYGFWGQQRVVARTIRLPEDQAAARRPGLESLSLRPVLYAAATRADDDVPGPIKPTQYLAEQIESLVGAGNVLRVSNWDEWRAAVRDHHPKLLVVLGHTETSSGETILEIGKDSWLHDPDVRSDVLRAEGGAPPLVVLLACSTAVARDPFGGLPAAFTAGGAAAVMATLSKIHGPHGAKAAAAVVQAICEASAGHKETVGGALTIARRRLVEQGLLDGLLLVSHGEIDVSLTQ
jgi:hypothetical protein